MSEDNPGSNYDPLDEGKGFIAVAHRLTHLFGNPYDNSAIAQDQYGPRWMTDEASLNRYIDVGSSLLTLATMGASAAYGAFVRADALVSKPNLMVDAVSGELTGFGKEVSRLTQQGYTWSPDLTRLIPPTK